MKLDEYLDSLRDIERRITMAEEQSARELPVVDQPVGVPNDYAEHAMLMMDLLALAYQTDLTRISTFMLAREVSGRAYPEIGVPDSHHPLSHHQDEPGQAGAAAQDQRVPLPAVRLPRRQDGEPARGATARCSTRPCSSTGPGSATATRTSTTTCRSRWSAARRAGIQGGRYIRYPQDTPLSNLHVTILEKLGVPVESLGDSTGKLPRLTGV